MADVEIATNREDSKMDVLKKVPVREQDPQVRATNFEEVCLGYNKEEAMAHIATLNLTEEVTLLAEKNATFAAVYDEKLQEEVERLPQKDIDTEELRKQVDEKYAEIVQTVNAYAIVQPTEAIETFIAQMNALISLTKPDSGSSSGSSAGGTSDPDPGTTPEPEPTPTPDPEPTPDPDPDTGEDDDDEGGLAG